MSDRPIRFWDKNFGEGDIKHVRRGDVIVYSTDGALDSYLIVSEVKGDIISGQLATTIGLNGVSVEDIVEACALGTNESVEEIRGE
jgi:hypothetical protein